MERNSWRKISAIHELISKWACVATEETNPSHESPNEKRQNHKIDICTVRWSINPIYKILEPSSIKKTLHKYKEFYRLQAKNGLYENVEHIWAIAWMDLEEASMIKLSYLLFPR